MFHILLHQTLEPVMSQTIDVYLNSQKMCCFFQSPCNKYMQHTYNIIKFITEGGISIAPSTDALLKLFSTLLIQ